MNRSSSASRLLIAMATLSCLICGCQGQSAPASPANSATAANRHAESPSASSNADRAAEDPAAASEIAAFCGDCHALPPPSSFAKSDWRKEISRAYDIYRATGRQDLAVPDLEKVVSYYSARAPEQLRFPRPADANHPSPFQFRTQLGLLPAGGKEAAVSSLVWHKPPGAAAGKLLLCDMRSGLVGEVKLEFEPEFLELARLKNAALLEPADLDSDGKEDYLVAELGSYLPQDHQQGAVAWLRRSAEGKWETHVILDHVGRVAHAVDGDFDGDGMVDVVVAEFGWISTGKIHFLRGAGQKDGIPQFDESVIDSRHGASHLRKIDWERDGDLDFVALVSQEHEKVELFLNDGSGTFRIETIFAAADPNFGSSGIELVDLDADGDLDVLHTNGDAVDSFQVKPFHAVRWLENAGSFPFREHELTSMPGVYKAVAADFDGDGDQDIAAIAFPPEAATMRAGLAPPKYDMLVFLEQTERGRFARHAVRIPIGGLALAAGDFDGDGDVDLASGNFGLGPAGQWLTIWWNKLR